MFTIIEALRWTLDTAIDLMKKYPDDFNLRNGFYMQAYGAVSMLALTSYEDEARALWEEHEQQLQRILWGR
jgi:hypothetical protein